MNQIIKPIQNGFKHLLIKIKQFFQIIFDNKKATIGLVILLFFIFIALFGRMIIDFDDQSYFDKIYQSPSFEHWLGTDNLGRDLLHLLIYGTQDVLEISLYSAIIVVGLGTTIGIISGYLGSWVDATIGLIINVIMSIPTFPILIILSMFITIQDNWTMAFLLGIFAWPGLARTIRSQIVSLRERDYIQICKVMGLSNGHIIFKELLPNVFSYVVINFINSMKNALTASVGLMTLGLALYEPTNWGGIIISARNNGALAIPAAQLTIIAPIVAIMLFQMGALLFSNGLDEVMNPRLRRS